MNMRKVNIALIVLNNFPTSQNHIQFIQKIYQQQAKR